MRATPNVGETATATPYTVSPPLQVGTPTVLHAPSAYPGSNPTGDQSLTLAGGDEDPPTLDPALVRDAQTAFLGRQIFRGLVRVGDDLSVVPDLAETIDVSPDHSTYNFHLFDGLHFQHGRPLSAADVKYSFERATDPELAADAGGRLPAASFLSDIQGAPERLDGRAQTISGIVVLSQQDLRITLSRPTEDFLQKLTALQAVVVNPDDVARGGDWWRSPDGSGPFMLSDWKSGQRLVLTGFGGYRPHPPTLKTVTILLGASAQSPMTLYERGKIDVTGVPGDQLARVVTPGLPMHDELHAVPVMGGSYVFLNPNVAPFNDPEFRRGLVLGFDRTKISTASENGYEPSLQSLAPSIDGAGSFQVDLPAYDLTAARATIDQVRARMPDLSLTLYTAGSWTPVAMQRVYQRDLGLPSEVVELEFADYERKLNAHQLGALSEDWIADYPDPGSVLVSLFSSSSPDNPTGYRNPEVDRLLAAAQVEPDPQRRVELYRQAEGAIVAHNVVIPIVRDVDYELIKPAVHGLAVTPLGFRGLETVWMTH